MRVSVVIPSRDRTEQLVRTVKAFRDTAPAAEIVVVADRDDTVGPAVAPLGVVVVENHTQLPTPDLWNLGATYANGDVFVLGANDLLPRPGWMEAMLEAMKELEHYGVVALNDLSPLAGQLATHYAVSRAYAVNELGGVMAPPAYMHFLMDNEITERAQRDRCLRYAADAIVEHLHPAWGKAENDAVYNGVTIFRFQDEETYQARREQGFPNDWKPRLTMRQRQPQGWGRVAIATRIAKHPEPAFFNAWTNLVLGGLRAGDTVINAPTGLPHHVAANEIVRKFLSTTADSLLFIDDDMLFAPNALEQIRRNEANWQYDAVQAFCTHKTVPPHAVVMRKMDPQPGPPVSFGGTRYGALKDIEDGALVEVDVVGLGFTLIKRHVFEGAINPHGAMHTYWYRWGDGNDGEDVVFSQNAQREGYRLAVDTSVKVDHLGTYAFGWQSWMDWKNQMKEVETL